MIRFAIVAVWQAEAGALSEDTEQADSTGEQKETNTMQPDRIAGVLEPKQVD
jgi:hypothetical protein